MKHVTLLLVVTSALAGCSYVSTATKQAYYAVRQPVAPRQHVYKHMLARETYFVFGRIETATNHSLAVVAVSDRFKIGEVVDVNQTARDDSYFGLNLPEGEYHLLAVCDRNGDGVFDEREIIGTKELVLDRQAAPEKVLGGVDVSAGPAAPPRKPFRIAVQPTPVRTESVFYPKGTIRTLDDPIFAPAMAGLGLYEPAAFLEAAPMMFYALEEDAGYKVPVVFVHGINGSARDFAEIVAHLDRRRYRPWFFHYPSGMDLRQLSAMFHRVFLSGGVIPHQDAPLVIVAHSMGGLVVRDALNRQTGKKQESGVGVLITIATPWGGHPAARTAARAPVVIPSWRDLNPDSRFLRELHRQPLPGRIDYRLYYACGLTPADQPESADDGVVPLASQRQAKAQGEAHELRGFRDTHAGVLRNPEAIQNIIQAIETVKPPFPDDHLRVLFAGGYPVPVDQGFTAIEAYCIRTIGRYMDALVAGELQPIDPLQAHFVAACRGECPPNVPAERAWLKYRKGPASKTKPG